MYVTPPHDIFSLTSQGMTLSLFDEEGGYHDTNLSPTPANLHRAVPQMAQASAPRELLHALRVLETPETDWVRQFMLGSDFSADLAILLSPIQNAHACNFNDYGCGSAIGPFKFDFGGQTSYLLIPAMSVNDHTVGLAIHRSCECGVEFAGTGDKAAFPEKISIDYNYGKFCFHNRTGELLLLSSVLPAEVDDSLYILAIMLGMHSGRKISVPQSMRNRAMYTINWWAPKERSCGDPRRWKEREELTAICDMEMLIAGNYADCVAMSAYGACSSRTTCADCCDKVILSSLTDKSSTLRANTCDCSGSLSQPDSPFDFSKFCPNLKNVGGNFSGTKRMSLGLPGLAFRVAFDTLSSLSVSFKAKTDVAEELRGVAINGVMRLAKPPRTQISCFDFPITNIVSDNQEVVVSDFDESSFEILADCVMARDFSHAIAPRTNCNVDDRISSFGTVDQEPLCQASSCALSTYIATSFPPTSFEITSTEVITAPEATIQERSGIAVAIAPGHGTDYNASRAAAVDREFLAKKEMRRTKNRAAAARSNAKRKYQNDSLKKELREAREHLASLQDRFTALHDEKQELIRMLASR